MNDKTMKTNQKQRIEAEVEQTLRAISGIERAAPKPFFVTRAEARLASRRTLIIRPIWAFRPHYMAASLALVLLLNLSAVLYVQHRVTQHEQEQESAGVSVELGLDANGLIW